MCGHLDFHGPDGPDDNEISLYARADQESDLESLHTSMSDEFYELKAVRG